MSLVDSDNDGLSDNASELEEDTDYVGRSDREDSGHCETREIRSVNKAPLDVFPDTHGCGEASSSGVWCRGRMVHNPFRARDDVGGYGVYVGNWSGRRKLAVINDHIAADLIARNPAQILIAQEVDEKFIAALLDPESSSEARSAPHPVAGQNTPTVVGSSRNYDERPQCLKKWHVAKGSEGDGSQASTLIVAARSSLAKSSTVVEWQKMFHSSYKIRGRTSLSYSRILVAQVEWQTPMWGLTNVQILNLHCHHMVAKKVIRDHTQHLIMVFSPTRKHHGEEFLWTSASAETLHHGVFVLAKTPW